MLRIPNFADGEGRDSPFATDQQHIKFMETHNENSLYNQKIITILEDDMLNIWKQRMRLHPAARNCIVERSDGYNIDNYLKLKIREWYAHALAFEEACFLPQEDVASDLPTEISENGVVYVTLPNNVVRPVEWKMRSWDRLLTVFEKPDSFMARLQYCPLTRSGTANPVAVQLPHQLLLYRAKDRSDQIEKAVCVVRPPEGIYSFDEALLSTVPDSLQALEQPGFPTLAQINALRG